MNQGFKNVFTPGHIVSYRSARKISSYFVRAKLYPLERKNGSEKCGKSRCDVWLNIQETDTFTSTTTGESFKIKQKLKRYSIFDMYIAIYIYMYIYIYICIYIYIYICQK